MSWPRRDDLGGPASGHRKSVRSGQHDCRAMGRRCAHQRRISLLIQLWLVRKVDDDACHRLRCVDANRNRCSAIEGSLSDHAPSAREITSYRSRWWVSVLLWPGDRGHQWAVLVAAHGQFLLAVDTVNPGIHRSHPDQGGGEPIQPPTAAQTDSVESNPFFVAQQVPGADVQLTGCS